MNASGPPDNKPKPGSNVPAETGNKESSKPVTSEEQVKTENEQLIMEENSASRLIAHAWRNHRHTREEEGKILSASSRDLIVKSRRSCLHLPGETCPVWSQWEELLNAVEEHLRRKEILEEPPSSNQKLGLALCVVERIAKGSSSVKNHLWLILDTEHWLEICDEKHRYGSNLKVYHDYWLKTSSPENFFEWLDKGSGKNLDLEARPRKLLEEQRVRYLTKKERAEHEVTFKDGLLIYLQSGKPVHTNPPDELPNDPDVTDVTDVTVDTQTLTIPRSTSPAPSSPGSFLEEIEEQDSSLTKIRRGSIEGGPKREKWIYVTDCDGKFYVGQKMKGHFHHSSFLAGGAICAAGGIKVREGKLLEINPNSGHYKPAQHHFKALVEKLIEKGISVDGVKVTYPNENLEKQLMARYKFKRLAMLSMVYDDIVRDASNSINQKIDTMDRHVSMVSNYFRRNMSETVNTWKESIKEMVNRVMPSDDKKDENEKNHISDNIH